MKIWCVFSVDNEYHQPQHNLVVWWKERPTFDALMTLLHGRLDCEAHVIACAGLLHTGTCEWPDNTEYRLEQVEEGYVLANA